VLLNTNDSRTRDYLAINQNLREAMRFFGSATGVGETVSLPGSVAIYSGLNYGVFNIALLDAPDMGTTQTTNSEQSLEIWLDEVALFFKQRTGEWSFWLCEDLLGLVDQRRAHQVLRKLGMRVISNPPGMIAETLAPPHYRLPEVELRPVDDALSRQHFSEITTVCFEIPPGIARRIYIPERAWAGAYQGFLGYSGGQAVSMVATVEAGGVLGIYSLGTLPEYRRAGYGEATLRAAVAENYRRTGVSRVILQSTEAGHMLYQRMGFRDVTHFAVYLTK